MVDICEIVPYLYAEIVGRIPLSGSAYHSRADDHHMTWIRKKMCEKGREDMSELATAVKRHFLRNKLDFVEFELSELDDQALYILSDFIYFHLWQKYVHTFETECRIKCTSLLDVVCPNDRKDELSAFFDHANRELENTEFTLNSKTNMIAVLSTLEVEHGALTSNQIEQLLRDNENAMQWSFPGIHSIIMKGESSLDVINLCNDVATAKNRTQDLDAIPPKEDGDTLEAGWDEDTQSFRFDPWKTVQ